MYFVVCFSISEYECRLSIRKSANILNDMTFNNYLLRTLWDSFVFWWVTNSFINLCVGKYSHLLRMKYCIQRFELRFYIFIVIGNHNDILVSGLALKLIHTFSISWMHLKWGINKYFKILFKFRVICICYTLVGSITNIL